MNVLERPLVMRIGMCDRQISEVEYWFILEKGCQREGRLDQISGGGIMAGILSVRI